jgi:DNA repair protein RadD
MAAHRMNASLALATSLTPPHVGLDRWYQEESVDALFRFFEEHGGTDAEGRPIRANPLIALPTGTGKSFVLGKFLERAFRIYPQTRAIMATHIKELIEQNAKQMQRIWPHAPLGIYSAGLKQKDFIQPIVFGGVKSMVGKYDEHGRSVLGYRDLLVIDEAHLVGPSADSSYGQLILDLLAINPYMKIIGLSATIYRLGMGLLTNGPIFSHIAYDLTNIEGFGRLIAEGYLAPIFPKKTATELDVSGVGLSSTGDFAENQLQAAVDDPDVTYKALCEVMELGMQRRSWLVFASGIEHAEHIGEMLRSTFGVPTGVVHSKRKDRDETIAAFKRGELRCIVNKDILTTGFDHPPVDLIAMMRPTMSTGLWVQMLGRGTRPYDWRNVQQYIPGFEFTKHHCLVLDFAGNTRRLGPINDPVIPNPKGKGRAGDAPVKICDGCGAYNHTRARECIVCGEEFKFAQNIVGTASNEELLRSDLPVVEYFDVLRVVYSAHTSRKSGKHSVKVAYYCNGLRTFYEWVTVEGDGFPKKKGRDWFRQRAPVEPPETNAEVLHNAEHLRIPRRIRVWLNKRPNPEVLSYEF